MGVRVRVRVRGRVSVGVRVRGGARVGVRVGVRARTSLVRDELPRDLEVERVLRALDHVRLVDEQRAPLGVRALVTGWA